MKVKFLYRKDFTVISSLSATFSAKKKLLEEKTLVVSDENGYVGLLCPEDLAQRSYNLVIDCLSTKEQISVDQDVNFAFEIMKRNDVSALPVFHESSFVGVLLQSDILEYLIEEKAKLEKSVSERTLEIELTNRELKAEIEERKKVENQLVQSQKMEAIGTLAGGIAHDFNNILSIIMGYGELILAAHPPESDMYNMQLEVVKAGRRARDLVQQILSFGRKSKIEKKPVIISGLVKDSLKMLRSTIPSTILIDQDVNDCGVVFADPTQLHQIVINLCTNAFQAIPSQNGIISISLNTVDIEHYGRNIEQKITQSQYAKLEVSDNGQGMDKDVLDRMYEPYFTTKECGKGTGLGLAVVHGIVKSLNGHIEVQSEKDKGTVFSVYIPLSQIKSDDKKLGNWVSRQTNIFSLGGENILVVDDEKSIVEMKKLILDNLGYHVHGFVSASNALKSFQKNPTDFDLVITDMAMPEMSGIDFIEKIRKLRENIPVILYTGFSKLIDKEKADELNINKFLTKPISTHELSEAVREVIDNSK